MNDALSDMMNRDTSLCAICNQPIHPMNNIWPTGMQENGAWEPLCHTKCWYDKHPLPDIPKRAPWWRFWA